ncbi:MAG: porin [Rhodoferax sp.]|nr:porin [Rhodoferax sp.]
MKKTLIAMAAIATTQMAMAQVTVTGELGYGYNKIQAARSATSTSGLMMTDGEINFKAVEDLGGGFKVTVNSAVQLKGRDSAMKARDATIAFLTPIGQVTAGTIDSDSEYPRAFADAKISLPSDKQVAGGDNVDVIAFTTKLGPVYTTLSYTEGGTQDVLDLATALGAPMPAAALGLPSTAPFPSTVTFLNGGTARNLSPGGPGAGGGPVQITSLNASYAEGPLSVGLTVSSYAVSASVQDVAGAGLFRSAYDGRVDTSVSGAYNFGVAKVGVGYKSRSKGWGTETEAGISVPVGAFSFGLTFEQKEDDTKTIGDGVTAGQFESGAIKRLVGAGDPTLYLGGKANIGDFVPGLIAADLKGTAKRTKIRVGVDYAFSKMTSLNFSYGTYELGSAARPMTALGTKQASNMTTDEFQLRLMKKF